MAKTKTPKIVFDSQDYMLYAEPEGLRALADALDRGERFVKIKVLDPMCDETFGEGSAHRLDPKEWK